MSRFHKKLALIITVLVISMVILIAFVMFDNSSQPTETAKPQEDQLEEQPTDNSPTVGMGILDLIIMLLPVVIVVVIIQVLVKMFTNMQRETWDIGGSIEDLEDLKEKIKQSEKQSCRGTYDAGNEKCSSCEDNEQCKKDTADAVKKDQKGMVS